MIFSWENHEDEIWEPQASSGYFYHRRKKPIWKQSQNKGKQCQRGERERQREIDFYRRDLHNWLQPSLNLDQPTVSKHLLHVPVLT